MTSIPLDTESYKRRGFRILNAICLSRLTEVPNVSCSYGKK